MKRGQVSLELLVTLGMVLALTIPVILLLFSISQSSLERTSVLQADASAKTLADAINEVYAEGPDAKRTIFLNLPFGTDEITVNNNEVTVIIETGAGAYEAATPIFATAQTDPNNGLDVRGVTALVIETNNQNEVIVHA